MVNLWAAICSVTIAWAVAVQGASLVERGSCPKGDHGRLKCETSGASPLVPDCQAAIAKLAEHESCIQSNGRGSYCTTIVQSGSCKIDICGQLSAGMRQQATTCKTYLKNLLADCKSGNVVGGQIFPQTCSVNYPMGVVNDPDLMDWKHYRLQFSHAQ